MNTKETLLEARERLKQQLEDVTKQLRDVNEKISAVYSEPSSRGTRTLLREGLVLLEDDAQWMTLEKATDARAKLFVLFKQYKDFRRDAVEKSLRVRRELGEVK